MSQPPPDIHLPSPSVWPFVLGAGVALLAFGAVTTLMFCVAGVIVVALGLAGWIGDLLHE
jgi:hypothetical protein